MRRFLHHLVTVALVVTATMCVATSSAFAAGDTTTPPPDAATTAIGLAAVTAFVFALLGFLKSLRNREWNAVLTTLCWWAAGIVGLIVFAQTQWAAGVQLAGHSLTGLSIIDLIVIGIAPGSFGITLNQGYKAFDNTQTAAQPPLAPGKVSPGQGDDHLPAVATGPFTGETIPADVAEAAGSFTTPEG